MTQKVKLNMSQLKEILKINREIGCPTYIKSSFGLGKSECVEQFAEKIGVNCHLWILSQMDAISLLGLPYLSEEEKGEQWTKFTKSWIMKVEEGDIIFLDEITSALPSVRASIYEFVNKGFLGGHYLGKRVQFVLAGNLESDRGVVTPMERPLLNRMSVVSFGGPTIDEFVSWASIAGASPIVVSFLKENPKWLLSESNPENEINPTPRSWMKVSDYLNKFFSKEESKDELVIPTYIGMPSYLQLKSFIVMGHKLTKIEDIIADPSNAKLPAASNFNLNQMQVYSILNHLTKENSNVFSKYIERLPGETILTLILTLIKSDNKMLGVKLAMDSEKISEIMGEISDLADAAYNEY